ncbi:MAG TPA: hypothetical protein VMY43_07340 [Methanothrix sp.]|nr:hypothetical protein [Methanothrix sp.]
MPSETHLLDEEKTIKGISIPSYDSIVFNYTIRANITRSYILPQATITFYSDGSSKKLYSVPLYLKVINSYPEIISITLSSTPFIDTKNISFNIKFTDADKNETMGVQVWSNIEGLLLNKHPIKNLGNNCYQANVERKLSLGTHLLTFKINDSHNGFIEKEMAIEIKQDFYHEYFYVYHVAIVIMLCSIINVLNVLGIIKILRTFISKIFSNSKKWRAIRRKWRTIRRKGQEPVAVLEE